MIMLIQNVPIKESTPEDGNGMASLILIPLIGTLILLAFYAGTMIHTGDDDFITCSDQIIAAEQIGFQAGIRATLQGLGISDVEKIQAAIDTAWTFYDQKKAVIP